MGREQAQHRDQPALTHQITWTPKSSKIAAEYFERAIKEDPGFALAHVGLAETYTIMSDQGQMKPLEAAQKISAGRSWIWNPMETVRRVGGWPSPAGMLVSGAFL